MNEHPILGPLPPEQQAVIDILGEHWLQRRTWPVFDCLRRRLFTRSDVDAMETMSRLPIVQAHQQVYRLIFTERGGPFAEPEQRVGLTIAGLYHLPSAAEVVRELVGVIGYLADADAALEPDPDRAVTLDLPLHDLASTLLVGELVTWGPDDIAQALEHEPPTWSAVRPGPDNMPRIQAPRGLPLFRGVRDPGDYLRRVIRMLGADAVNAAAPAVVSPLDLPEALGYLDAVWQVRFGSHLLGWTPPSVAAKLALPCASTDEFDGRLSALADVLGHLTAEPSRDGDREGERAREGSLARLRQRLAGELEPASFERVNGAIRRLQLVVRIRAGGQHSGRGGETAEAFRELGLPYPPSDWGAAWEEIRSVSAGAIDAVREELQGDRPPA